MVFPEQFCLRTLATTQVGDQVGSASVRVFLARGQVVVTRRVSFGDSGWLFRPPECFPFGVRTGMNSFPWHGSQSPTQRLTPIFQQVVETNRANLLIGGNQKRPRLEYVAIGVRRTVLMWRTKTREGLDMLSEFPYPRADAEEQSRPLRRRGMPSAFTDEQLWNRRDQLIQTFEASWGRVGRELPRVKRAEDIAAIFRPLQQGYISDIISVYCRPSSQPASQKRLREIRCELRKQTKPWLDAEKTKSQALEQLQIADAAIVKGNRRPLDRARKARRKEAARAMGEYRTLDGSRRKLESQIREFEPSLARHELFRFVKSKRYEINAENLANATAGVPYMGWRQSMRRCKKRKSLIANGGAIQVFKAIRYLVGIAVDKDEKSLVAHFRRQIPSLPSRYKLPKTEFADKWLYLERAIRQACRSKPHPKFIHFEITERYFAQLRSFSMQDRALALQNRLTLSTTRDIDRA